MMPQPPVKQVYHCPTSMLPVSRRGDAFLPPFKHRTEGINHIGRKFRNRKFTAQPVDGTYTAQRPPQHEIVLPIREIASFVDESPRGRSFLLPCSTTYRAARLTDSPTASMTPSTYTGHSLIPHNHNEC